jgi:FkbM family methyltransferase
MMIDVNKLNKFIKSNKIILIVLFIVVILVFLFIKILKNENYINFESNIETVKNPYIKSDIGNVDIYWQKQSSEFMTNNYPANFDFDFSIKEDIIAKALTLPQGYCIIDCGAHIGDGSIPIAHALKYNNREDIIVYAIDPSKYKCDFINFIKKKNNLNNLIVLNYGLSNMTNTYKSLQQSGINTGGWDWIIDNDATITDENKDLLNKFVKLDDLVKDNIITQSIGIIHFDVEGMEKEALQGSINTITKYKPYMSIENNIKSGKDNNGNDNNKNNEYFLQFLPKGYKYLYNKNENNVLAY